jgi:hypothetical protein
MDAAHEWRERYMMEDRRQAQRQSAAWKGSCHIEGESPNRWRDCEVVDISSLGMGVEFHTPAWSSDLTGRHISVDLPAVGASIKMILEGEIRNVSTHPDGIIRAGVMFVGLSDEECSIADVLALASLGSSTT